MKKLLLYTLSATLLFLSSCGRKSAEPLVLSGPSNSVGTQATSEIAINRAEETLPLYASSSAYYSDGTVFSTASGLLMYTPVETGATRPLCFDPLCTHEYATDCPARVNTGMSRVIVKDGLCWFTAQNPQLRVGDPLVYQLRVMDVTTGKVRVLYERDSEILDFWLIGDTVCLSVPYEIPNEGDPDGTSYMGGSIARLEADGSTTVVLADPEYQDPVLTASDEGALYYTGKYGTTPVYCTDYAFSASVPVTELAPMGYGIEIFDGWMYWIRLTGESIRDEGEEIDGDFDPDVSVTSREEQVGELVRQKVGGGEAEILCPAVPLPRVNAGGNYRLFRIDREENALYYVPLDLQYDGYVIWEFSAEEKAFLAQMGGIHDKLILTKKFAATRGRLVRLDLSTQKSRDVLSDCGADIVDLYAVEDGRVWARFEQYDVDTIKSKIAAGERSDSRLTYAYIGSEELLP